MKKKNSSDKKMKEYFVFEGQNASTGEPNRITGIMSFWGTYHKFSSKKAAMKYVDKNDSPYVADICVAGTRATLRKYDLGNTVAGYNENLDWIEVEGEE